MTTEFEKLLETPRGRTALCVEMTITNVTELISQQLEVNEMSKKQLAEQLGITPGRITQMLDGSANLTLTRVLAVFGQVLEVSAVPLVHTSGTEWMGPGCLGGAPPSQTFTVYSAAPERGLAAVCWINVRGAYEQVNSK